MSIHRYDAKVDLAQGAIVAGLQKAGIKVFPIGQPCDLLVQFWCNRHQNFCWQTLECKTPDAKGRRRKRHDQEKQDEFSGENPHPRRDELRRGVADFEYPTSTWSDDMSTPQPIVFTPLLKGFSWTPAVTDTTGAALPPGETESGTTIGIRPDPTTAATPALQTAAAAFGPGNYQYLIIVPPTQNSEAPAAIQAALNKALVPGVNYWAALDQTDMLSGSPSTSAWTPEVGFVIPVPAPVVVKPASPTNFSAA